MSAGCPLCEADGGALLWRDDALRVIAPHEPDYPGFLRVVWNAHVRELTDLSVPERTRLMNTVFAVEAAVREVMRPDKLNVASLGNVVPHLHIHVIPRYHDDPHFPNPVWGQRLREAARESPVDWRDRLANALKVSL